MSSTAQLDRTEAPSISRQQRSWLAPALISGVVCLVYLGTVGFQFVYDDPFQIVDNPWLSWHYIPQYFTKHVWAFAGISGVYWRPLFLLWLLFQHALFGTSPAGFHAFTVLLHALATVLVYGLALRLTRDRATAIIAALIFGVHPALIESVAWVSGCTDPLLACWLIAAFLAFLNWREYHSGPWLLASLGAYALALMSKEPAVMLLPLVFVFTFLVAATDSGRIPRARSAVMAVLPYLPLTLIYGLIHHIIEARMDRSSNPATPLKMALTAPSLLLFYLRLLVFPWPISPEYEMKLVPRFSATAVLLPSIVLIAIFAAIYAWTRYLARAGDDHTARVVRFASLWMLLPIMPVLYIAALAAQDFAHARYLYLPCIGFALLLACAIRRVPGPEHRVLNVPLTQAAIATVIIGAMALGNVMQQGHWASNLLLFYRGTRIAPHNPIALTGLAIEMGKRQQYDKALALFRDAMDQDAWDQHTNFSFGYTYYLMGRYTEAEFYLERAVQIRPEDVQADQFAYVAMTELKLGKLPKAELAIRQSVQRQPRSEKYHYALGLILEQQGKAADAARAFEATLAINPGNADARARMVRLQGVAQ
ncbi:MAG: tetratricopeptide repeat protein [Terriglobales bacterium]